MSAEELVDEFGVNSTVRRAPSEEGYAQGEGNVNVTVNTAVSGWMSTQTQAVKNQYNTKCTEAMNNDLSTWRHVGGGSDIYDYRVSGDFRAVARKTNNNFDVAAIYRHATNGGKTKVVGATVTGY